MFIKPRFILAEETILGTGGGGGSTAAQQTQQTTQATTTAGGDPPPARPEWVPEKFWDATKGAADTEKLGSAYISLEKQFSTKRTLTAPLPGDPPEKQEAYLAELRKVTGAPDKPEGYGLKAPEKMPEGVTWNEEHAGKLAALAHKHALPPSAVADLVALKLELEQGANGQAKTSMDEYVKGQRESLQKEWGGDYDKNVSSAVSAAANLGVDLSSHETFTIAGVHRLLQRASLMMREDKMLGHLEGSSKSAAEQIEEIRRGDAYQGKQGTEVQAAAAKRMEMLAGIKA